MPIWFVSISPLPARGSAEGYGWTIRRFATVSDAKNFAREALLMGYRIEAGTADGVVPEIRIGPQELDAWATTPDALISSRKS